MSKLGTAYHNFREAWRSPAEGDYSARNSTYDKRLKQYEIMQAAYDGTIFNDTVKWGRYIRDHDLHEKVLALYNPTQRLCDFYASHLYPGYLSSSGYPVANNIPLAIPLVTESDELRAAIGVSWQWSNWQSNLILWVTYCASLGDGPVEIIDDVEKGKVYMQAIRPEHITDVKFDERGNVISYTKSFTAWDADKEEYYKYTRVINKKTIRTFKNGNDFSYIKGQSGEYENPYGFCPLVWCKHRENGTHILPGKPAIRDWRKIEELNSDFIRLRSFVKKQALTPQILAGMGKITPPVSEISGERIDIEDITLLLASAEGKIHKLEGNLDIQQSLMLIDRQISEINEDHPELKAYQELREMSQTTGPAADKLLGNVINNVRIAAMNYDKASIQQLQIMLAIGGMRANERSGGWSNMTVAQKKFLPFDLDSLAKGDLDFDIAPREVIPKGEQEVYQTERDKYNMYKAAEDAGVPLESILIQQNISEKKLEEFKKLRKENWIEQLSKVKDYIEINKKTVNIDTPADIKDIKFKDVKEEKPATNSGPVTPAPKPVQGTQKTNGT